jgi:hypothetical protein
MSIPELISGISLGSAYIRPGDVGPITSITYIAGGWITVDTTASLEDIDQSRTSTGQIAYISASQELYIAKKVAADWITTFEDSVTWSEFSFPGGAGFPFSGSAVITGSLLVSQSVVDFTNATAISGSVFSGSFVGDGSGLTGIASSLYLSGSSGNTIISLKDEVLLLTGSSAGIIATITNNTASFTISDEAVISGSFSGSFSGLIDNAVSALTASYFTGSHIDFTPLSDAQAPPHREGRVWYDADNGALAVYNDEADITLQVGQEFYVRAYNDSGNPILNGTPVYVSQSQGDYPKIWPATAEDHTTGTHFDNHILGLATHDIEDSSAGYVTRKGVVRNVDTTDFAAGDVVYLQTGSAGLRNTPPPFPYDVVQVGFVVRSQANGFILVEPSEPVHFNNISGLSGSGAAENHDLWVYDGSNNAWYNTHSGLELSGSFSGSFQGEITASGMFLEGDLTVTGDLTVFGSSSLLHITSSQLDVASAYISVNVYEPAERFGGLYVYDSGSSAATASLTWDSLNNKWVYSNSSDVGYSGGGLISGPRNTGSLGQETFPTNNYVVRSQGGDHIYDSNIYDDDTTVTVFTKLGVSGSTELADDLNLPNITNAGADPTKFLVISESAVEYRNAAQLAADLNLISANAIQGLGEEISFFKEANILSGSGQFTVNTGSNGAYIRNFGNYFAEGSDDTAGGKLFARRLQTSASLDRIDYLSVGYHTDSAELIVYSGSYGGGSVENGRFTFDNIIKNHYRLGTANFQTAAAQNTFYVWPKTTFFNGVNIRTGLTVTSSLSVTGSIYAASIGTGADNSVVILDSDGYLRTDEIDDKVWSGNLIDGSGATNRVAYWSDSDTLTSDTDFFFNGTSVGIGTTSPGTRLEIANSSPTSVYGGHLILQSTELYGGPDSGSRLIFNTNVSESARSVASIQGFKENSTVTDYDGYLSFSTRTNGSALAERMRISSEGSVGIGTTGPEGTLHIRSGNAGSVTPNTSYDELVIENSGNTGISFLTPDSSTAGLTWATPSDSLSALLNYNNSNGLMSIGTYAAGSEIQLLTGNAGQSVRIDDSGNVGIGTTAPESPLHVVDGTTVLGSQPGILAKFENPTDGRTLIRVQNTNTSIGAAASAAGISIQAFSSASNQPESSTHEAQILLRAKNNSQDGDLQVIAPRSITFNVNNEDTVMTGSGYQPVGDPALYISSSGAIQLPEYGSGTFTGTATYTLRIDASGNIIEDPIGAGAVDGVAEAQQVTFWDDTDTISGSNDLTWDGTTFTINGTLEATEKSFVINHPTQENKKLVYGVLEGPEHAVYCRGKISTNVIELPEEWTGLVDEDTITVQLTSIGKHQNLYVEDIRDNKIFIRNANTFSSKINAFYYVQGTRKDVKPLVTVRDK